jgi:transcriptional regulator with XRE-family HTH domain
MMTRKNIQQKLGKKIRTIRVTSGLSQEQLGELTGLDRTYISGIERGVRNPSISNVEKIARALNVKVSDITSDI